MRDPAVDRGWDGKTSWKASVTEPANPTGEFLRWWAEATNQFAHAEPWQQPPRQSETLVWCVVCVCVCVCVCAGMGMGVAFTSVWVWKVCTCASSRAISYKTCLLCIQGLCGSCRVTHTHTHTHTHIHTLPPCALIYCVHWRLRLSRSHPMSDRLIDDLMNSLLRCPINTLTWHTHRCVCPHK